VEEAEEEEEEKEEEEAEEEGEDRWWALVVAKSRSPLKTLLEFK
jgi:hypothetical protein